MEMVKLNFDDVFDFILFVHAHASKTNRFGINFIGASHDEHAMEM